MRCCKQLAQKNMNMMTIRRRCVAGMALASMALLSFPVSGCRHLADERARYVVKRNQELLKNINPETTSSAGCFDAAMASLDIAESCLKLGDNESAGNYINCAAMYLAFSARNELRAADPDLVKIEKLKNMLPDMTAKAEKLGATPDIARDAYYGISSAMYDTGEDLYVQYPSMREKGSLAIKCSEFFVQYIHKSSRLGSPEAAAAIKRLNASQRPF